MLSNYNQPGEKPGQDPARLVYEDLPRIKHVTRFLVHTKENIQVGDVFTLNLALKTFEQSVDGMDIHLGFDPGVIRCEGIEWLDSTGTVLFEKWGNYEGTIHLALGYQHDMSKGDLPIAKIRFRAIAEGEAGLNFIASQTAPNLVSYQGLEVPAHLPSIPLDVTSPLSASLDCSVYPNPNSGHFNLRFYTSSTAIVPTKLRIYDISGKLLLEREIQVNHNQEEHISMPGKGIYVCQVMVHGEMISKKIVIK